MDKITRILLFIGAMALPLAILAQASCLSGNCENGYGVYRFDTGARYEGEWKNGVQHGWGTYLYNTGEVYSGFWKNGKQHYFGSYYWKSGAFFSGLWKNNDRVEHGLYVYASGTPEYNTQAVSYGETGCVLGDCENGYGVYIWSSGILYAGFWKDGKQHLWGNTFWDSDFCFSLYKNGQRQNRGLYVDGKGKATYQTERVVYAEKGCVSGNCENGFGAYIWNDGDLHVGTWKNGDATYFGAKYWENAFCNGLYKANNRQSPLLYVYESGQPEFNNKQPVDYLGGTAAPLPASVPKSGDGTIHVILFTDTDDSRIGTSCDETNKFFKNNFVPKLERYTGLTVKTYYFSGYGNFSLAKLNSLLGSLSTSSNDAIFFYFAGHGYNRGNSSYPTLTLGISGEPLESRQIDLVDVYNSLRRKNHRLLLVLAESCNKEYRSRNEIRNGNLVGNFDFGEDERSHFSELFRDASGDYLMSSSRRNELSHLATGQPGCFTCGFRDAFTEKTSRGNSGIARWSDILNQTANKTTRYAEEIGETQVPQWCNGYCN